MKRITVEERRARLAVRHRLAPGHRAGDVLDAARSVACLHGTDPATVYLSAWARMDGMTVPDLDRALHADRSLVKHLAMRRTLFVFPRELLPFVQAGASNRVADAERRRLVKEVAAAGLHVDGERWLADACEHVLAALAGGREASSSELRKEIALLEGAMTYGEGRSWGGQVSVGPRVLTILSAEGRIVRATNDGGWAISRPRWASMASWLGEPIETLPAEEGVAGLVSAWLRAFGPGTVADLKWWLGSTLTAVRRALVDVGAVEVDLDGQTGLVLPDDLEPTEAVPPWAALLPPLDPTTMGWTEREWYLGASQGRPLRHQWQRRSDDLVGRADRRRLAPAGGWRGRAPVARGHRRLRPPGRRARSRPPDNVVRRPAGPAPLPVSAVEGRRRPAVTPSISCPSPPNRYRIGAE